MTRLSIVTVGCLVLAGCTSPEATRQRGGGPGADPGNRPAQVKMHEGSRQYWRTPATVPGGGPSLEPSEQARRISLSGSSGHPQSDVAGGRNP